jgi:hypothetical protein
MLRAAALWLTKRIDFILPVLLLLPVLWALLPGGLPNSADGMVHFTRITEIVSSWRDGILLPRWSLNLGFGYGIPVFIYGPPLSYWLGALYNMLGLGPEAAYKAMLVTVLLIGATGAYRLGKVLLGLWAGAVAAVAFIYAPNQLFTLFVQGNAPQLLAWSFLPWTLWATIQIYRTQRPRDQLTYTLALALAVSGTLISHNVVSLILVPTVAALGLVLWIATLRQRALWMVAAGGALGGMMSAWFAVPALLETGYASTGAIVASDYHGRFVGWRELLAWPVRLDAGAINPYIPRTLGLPEVLVALLGLVLILGWLFLRRTLLEQSSDQSTDIESLRPNVSPENPSASAHTMSERPLRGDNPYAKLTLDLRVFWATAIFMTLYALGCALMATAWSEPIWAMLPLLNFFQFPARWIGFAGFGLAWLAAAAVGVVGQRVQPMMAGILCLFLLVPALVNLYPDKTPPGTRHMSPYDVVRYEVKSGAIGTTSYGEFNPRWAPRPLSPSPMVDDYMAHRPVDRLKGMLPAGASHRILKVTAHRQLYEITLPAPATITLNLLYFPGWRATINGTAAKIWPQAGTGLITLDLPAGENTLDLTFGPTPLRSAMNWLSGAAWIVLLLAFVRVKMGRTPMPAAPAHSVKEGGCALAILGTVICGVLLLQMAGADWFQLESPPDQALVAPIQRHEDVGEQFRLLGQNPLPTTIGAGDTLSVVVYWRSLADTDTNYAVVLQLDNVGNGQTLVTMEQSHPNNIPTSGWATGLYVRNEWQLSIPDDALPVQYTLRIGFRDPTTGEMLPTANGTTIELGKLWVLPENEPQSPAGPHARFGAAVELLGARTSNTTLTLYWRATAPVGEDDRIFIHLLDAEGQMVGQMDGLPFDNRYPIWEWRPEQVIEDVRDLTATSVDLSQIHSIAIGIYNPTTNERLAATDDAGSPLPDNALIIPWR